MPTLFISASAITLFELVILLHRNTNSSQKYMAIGSIMGIWFTIGLGYILKLIATL
jgi:hypothetical protein